MNAKTVITFLIFFVFVVSFTNAHDKYKRIYALKVNHFQHAASFSAGNAIIYVDRDSLIEKLQYTMEHSDDYQFVKGRMKSVISSIISLSSKSDTTNVSAIITDQEIIDITLSYFSECVLNKKGTIVDSRTNQTVTKIIVKKAAHSTKSVHTYSYYYYFLPNDRKEFMHRIERIGSGVKFL